MKIKNGVTIVLVVLGVSFAAQLASAQQSPPATTQPAQARPPTPVVPGVAPTAHVASVPNLPNLPNDPLAEAMFPPDLIMRHARELELTSEQKTFMRGEIQRTTTQFNELQWQLQDAMEALAEIMKSDLVNEQQALGQLDKVLDAEREIKRLHIGMGLRIKNRLTPEQKLKLKGLRTTPRPGRE